MKKLILITLLFLSCTKGINKSGVELIQKFETFCSSLGGQTAFMMCSNGEVCELTCGNFKR